MLLTFFVVLIVVMSEPGKDGTPGPSQPGKTEQGEPSQPKKVLTPEAIKANIKLGWYEVQFDTTKGATSAYDVIQKVFRRANDGGERLRNWFFCSRCEDVINYDVSMGTGPLVRHKEKSCPQLTIQERQKYKAEAAARKQLIAKKKAKDQVLQTVESDTNVEAVPNTPNEVPAQSNQAPIFGCSS